MQIQNLTTDLMRMLELKLLDHLPPDEFNRNNMASNVMNNLIENIFKKSLNEVKRSGGASVMMPQLMLKTCLEKTKNSFQNEGTSIQVAFLKYLKENQSETIFDEASQMSEYLIGALPVLIEEYMFKNDFKSRG